MAKFLLTLPQQCKEPERETKLRPLITSGDTCPQIPGRTIQGRREKVLVPAEPGKAQKGASSKGWGKERLRES